jgi:hypothetical protein
MSHVGYEPLAQSADEEAVVEVQTSDGTHGLRRAGRPTSIDLSKLDNAFKR